MKYLLSVLTLMALCATGAAAADVGVSISVGQPGFYGQLDIGDYPRPALIYSRPVIIERGYPRGVIAPIYLRVPPGHARNWRRYCDRYDACGRPVYFVQDRWYNHVYVPRYRERYMDRDDRGYYHQRDAYRDHARDERHDHHRDRDNDHDGRGRGHDRY